MLELSLYSKYLISDDNIFGYLNQCNKIYNEIKNMNNLKLYEYLLNQEKEYFTNSNSFVHNTHKLFTNEYNEYINIYSPIDKFFTIKDIMKCNACKYELKLQECYQIHILGQKSLCECGETIDIEQILTMSIIKKYNINKSTLLGNIFFKSSFPEKIPDNLNIKNFSDLIKYLIDKNTLVNSWQKLKIIHDLKKNIIGSNITYLNIDIIKAMYNHIDFIKKICINYNFWNNLKNLNIAKLRYIKFMNLLSNNIKPLIPTIDIILIWNSYKSNILEYNKFCNQLNNSNIKFYDYGNICYIIDNFNEIYKSKEYSRTYIKWAEKFNEEYLRIEPTYEKYNEGHNNFCYNVSIIYPLYRWKRWNNCLSIVINNKLDENYNSKIICNLKQDNIKNINNISNSLNYIINYNSFDKNMLDEKIWLLYRNE